MERARKGQSRARLYCSRDPRSSNYPVRSLQLDNSISSRLIRSCTTVRNVVIVWRLVYGCLGFAVSWCEHLTGCADDSLFKVLMMMMMMSPDGRESFTWAWCRWKKMRDRGTGFFITHFLRPWLFFKRFYSNCFMFHCQRKPWILGMPSLPT